MIDINFIIGQSSFENIKAIKVITIDDKGNTNLSLPYICNGLDNALYFTGIIKYGLSSLVVDLLTEIIKSFEVNCLNNIFNLGGERPLEEVMTLAETFDHLAPISEGENNLLNTISESIDNSRSFNRSWEDIFGDIDICSCFGYLFNSEDTEIFYQSTLILIKTLYLYSN